MDSDRGLSSLPTDLGDFKQVDDLTSFLPRTKVKKKGNFLFNKDS